MARISNKSGKLNQENKSWSGRKERIKKDKKKKKDRCLLVGRNLKVLLRPMEGFNIPIQNEW